MAKVAVIGAGPAGIAAALQLTRSGHDVSVFERGKVGGTLPNAGWVENYPGYPGGISGKQLAKLMSDHFFLYVNFVHEHDVETIQAVENGFMVAGEQYEAVILATGTRPKRAGFPGEAELEAAGKLHYGIGFLDRWYGRGEAGIIGGGEASMDMALSLAESDIRVTIIHRSEPKGIRSLTEEARAEENITWLKGNVKQGRVHEEKAVIALEDQELAFDIVLVAVGREKALPELAGCDQDTPGLFIVGDAARGGLGQTAMAVGDGVGAAMALDKHLRSE